jgi:hypothetical protein
MARGCRALFTGKGNNYVRFRYQLHWFEGGKWNAVEWRTNDLEAARKERDRRSKLFEKEFKIRDHRDRVWVD